MGNRRERFAAALPAALREQLEDLADLEPRLEALLGEASATPGVTDDTAAFLEHVAGCLPVDGSVADSLQRIHAADLGLAWACSVGNEAAVARFHAEMTEPAAAAAARVVAADRVDDIVADVVGRLLVGDAGPPQIAKYSGRGRLAKWVQTVAMRAAQSRTRKKSEQPTDKIEVLAERFVQSGDPELEALKRRYRAQFKAAFGSALASLPAKRRNVLRLELLDGLTVEAIAKVYGVHVATVARWRASTRTALLDGTRRAFQHEHHVDGDEFQSIMRLIGSQLDVSLPRLLVEED